MSAPTVPSVRKPVENYLHLGRTALQSHFRAARFHPPAGLPHPPLDAFDSSEIWPWIVSWLKATYQTDIESLFVPADRKFPFEPYPATGDRGLYNLAPLIPSGASLRIAVAGDWATGTDISQQVADSISRLNPDLTLHLGDVYYVGTPEEVEENCLGKDTPAYKGVLWPKGSLGSFALNGNHEMYSGGHGYFERFLPTLGLPASRDRAQLRSYFCLDTPVWRILAVDTGYNAGAISGDCHLEPALLDWLSSTVDPLRNPKPTILLSHHQWFSGFGNGDYTRPASQLAPFFPAQEIVWLWGHEHRLALYDKFASRDPRLTAWCRCLGHGGMPVELPSPAYPNAERPQRVEYWDGLTDLYPARFPTLPDGTRVGTNGFALLTLAGPSLAISYHDADGARILEESFSPAGAPPSNWTGTLTRSVTYDPHILNQITYSPK